MELVKRSGGGLLWITQRGYVHEIVKWKIKSGLSLAVFWSNRAKFAYVAFSTAPHTLIIMTIFVQFTEEKNNLEKRLATKFL